MNFTLSSHVIERSEERGIPLQVIEKILQDPAQVVDNESEQPGQKVYQAIVSFAKKGSYLERIFVDIDKIPPVVKSVYSSQNQQIL